MSKLVPLGESHLRRAVSEYVEHYHLERNHQGVGNRLLTPAEQAARPSNGNAPVERRERLGGLLSFYHRRAARAPIDFWHTTGSASRGQDDNVRRVTLPSFMNNRKTTKRTVATSDLDPATLANVNVLKRQRQRMNRTLLKRRRQKSGQ